MQLPFTIRNQSCPNPYCSLHGQTNQGNIVVHSNKEKRLRCMICKKTWVAHRQETYYRLRIDPKKFEAAIALLRTSTDLRTVAKKVGVSVNTVQRWKRKRYTQRKQIL